MEEQITNGLSQQKQEHTIWENWIWSLESNVNVLNSLKCSYHKQNKFLPGSIIATQNVGTDVST